MTSQHLSDEAVAAFADGVLGGHARDRATRHINGCAECRDAVHVQREAAWALRAAPAPALPSPLRDRLREVPLTTPLTHLPTAVASDGSTMLSTFAPMAALVPAESPRTSRRAKAVVTTAAIVALAGSLAAGSVARGAESHTGAGSHPATNAPATNAPGTGSGGGAGGIDPATYLRGSRP